MLCETITLSRNEVSFDTNQAIDAGFKDFEDAIQHFSAIRAGSDCIVTRNISHFPPADVAPLTPKEFLASRCI